MLNLKQGRDVVSNAASLLLGGKSERKNDIMAGKKYVISEEAKERLEKFLYREMEYDTTSVEVNELLDLLENATEGSESYEQTVIDFFYDVYFRGKEGHDYTDEEITMSVNKMDIDKCVDSIKQVLYGHFDIKS